jgi:ABC-type branched-subunit amino acid transport system substrate-binding protein
LSCSQTGQDSLGAARFGPAAIQMGILLITIIGLLACQEGPIGAPPTVKIGLVAPFEGLHRPLGYEALFGVKLALQERNEAGGLHGHRVELVALNDFDDPAEARRQAQALEADPDVLGVVGHLSSETTLAAAPVYRQVNLAMSVPWPVVAPIPNPNRSGLVSVAATRAEAAALVESISRSAGIEQLTTLTTPYVDPLPSDLQALELDTDGVTAGEILLELKRDNRSLPVYGQVDVGSPQLVQVAEKAANGLIFVSPGPGPRVVESPTFREEYKNLAGFPPGPRAVLAYDAANVLLDAIDQVIGVHSGQPTRSEVSAAISSIERNGISGRITFDEWGRRKNAPLWVYQISNRAYPGILLIAP